MGELLQYVSVHDAVTWCQVEAYFIQNDESHVAKAVPDTAVILSRIFLSAVQNVAQDLCSHDHDGGVCLDGCVSCGEPSTVRAKALTHLKQLLVAQSLEGCGVDDTLAPV